MLKIALAMPPCKIKLPRCVRRRPLLHAPIGTANFSQPHDTSIDNAIQLHYARMASFTAFGEYPPEDFLQDDLRQREDPFAEAVRWHRLAEVYPMFLPVRGLAAFERL